MNKFWLAWLLERETFMTVIDTLGGRGCSKRWKDWLLVYWKEIGRVKEPECVRMKWRDRQGRLRYHGVWETFLIGLLIFICLQHIMALLEKQNSLFTDTADKLYHMTKENLVRARLPHFHIPAAVETLTTGGCTAEYNWEFVAICSLFALNVALLRPFTLNFACCSLFTKTLHYNCCIDW